MARLIAALVLAAALVALSALVTMEHRPNGYAMPLLVSWSPPSPDDSRLYANCPITPWARPTHSKEHMV
jgi:uncharacterized membrane protein